MHKPIINIALPIAILFLLSDDDRLGPLPALLLAVAIPALYGIWELLRTRKVNAMSVMGIVSVLLTGVIGVFQLDSGLFAVKEALVPLGFAALLLISNRSDFPLVKLLFDVVQRKERVERAVHAVNGEAAYRHHIERSGAIWAGIMTLSGVMKFTLASIVVTADAGTKAFNTQLATYEVVQIPTTMAITMVLILALIWSIGKGTGRIIDLPPSQVLRGGERLAPIVARLAKLLPFQLTPRGDAVRSKH
jgi:hypothetical protein